MKWFKKLAAAVLVAALALAMLTACSGISSMPDKTKEAKQVVNLINEVRKENGLEALKTNPAATDVAVKMADLYVKMRDREIAYEEYKTEREALRNIQVEGKPYIDSESLVDKFSCIHLLSKEIWTKRYTDNEDKDEIAFAPQAEYIGVAIRNRGDARMVAVIIVY